MNTLMTVKEFAALIGVHPRSIYRRIWENRQPGVYRVSKYIRIDVKLALDPPEIAPQGRVSAHSRLFTHV
jgi:hypothetical protein